MKHRFTWGFVLGVMVLIAIVLIFLTTYMFSDSAILPGDEIIKHEFSSPTVDFGWFHIALNAVLVVIIIIWIVFMIMETEESYRKKGQTPLSYFYIYKSKEDDNLSRKEEKVNPAPIKFKRWFWIGILIIFLFQLLKFGNAVYTQSVFLYNTSKKYHNTYQQKVEEKQGFYDKLWKTYLQKEKITNVNKETFIQVTKIIMENRRDGQNVTWKWLQENQNIPYSEFTAFYGDLSNFITKQREGYFDIEKACQTIANKNNTMLDTFPNNLYNRVLKLQRIKFEYGFLSDSTTNVFKSKSENLKP